MRFEDLVNQYIADLTLQGVILDGVMNGVNEDLQTAIGKATFLLSGEAKEKRIFFHKVNDVISWKFLTPSDKLEYEYREGDWNYPSYSKRIVAPIQLIMDDIGIKIYGWFQLNNLPVVNNGETVYLYCNVILPDHQTIIDQLIGVISIEENPN